MSQSILTSEACLSPSILDLNTLVGKLEETAQALLAVSQTIQSAASNPREHTPTEKRAVEYRTYRLPGFIVEEEQEMLRLYKANSWQEMFEQTSCKFRTLATLMQHFDTEQKIDGYLLNQIAETVLEPPLDMLDRLCSLVADFDLQSKA